MKRKSARRPKATLEDLIFHAEQELGADRPDVGTVEIAAADWRLMVKLAAERDSQADGFAAVPPWHAAIVPCSGSKLSRAAPAGSLYTGRLFRLAAQLAGLIAERWFIVSAKHRLLTPETVVEPYDQTIEPRGEYAEAWGRDVARDLSLAVAPGGRVLSFAGQRYMRHITGPAEALGITFECPLEGLAIGKQKQWLKQQLSTPEVRALEAA